MKKKVSGGIVRAAIEGKTFEGSAIFFGFSASPFRCPLSFGDEHSVFAVLLLPHCYLLGFFLITT